MAWTDAARAAAAEMRKRKAAGQPWRTKTSSWVEVIKPGKNKGRTGSATFEKGRYRVKFATTHDSKLFQARELKLGKIIKLK